MKRREFSVLLFIVLFFASCQKDTLDLTKTSKKYSYEREISMPLVQGNITFNDLLNLEPDSILVINILDTLGIYYDVEYQYYDTIKLSLRKDNITVEFAKLNYWFTNQFPVGLDAKMYLCDSLYTVIDTILFSSDPSEIFLPAAPVDTNGVVILGEVTEKKGVLDISNTTAENLLRNTDQLILDVHLSANTFSIVKILQDSYLNFRFAVDVKGKYEGYKN
jgi:hypothetical protein